jgi:hypothetical protein
MSDLAGDICLLLVRELEGFRREIALFPDDVSLWQTAPGITNTAGNLALHVAGNLQHFIGGVLGGTGYIRDRELEFSRRSGTRAEIVAEIDATLAVVRRVVPGVPAIVFDEIYPEAVIRSRKIGTRVFLLHLCAHAAYHLAQAGYLRRVITRDERSSGAIPLEELTE